MKRHNHTHTRRGGDNLFISSNLPGFPLASVHAQENYLVGAESKRHNMATGIVLQVCYLVCVQHVFVCRREEQEGPK